MSLISPDKKKSFTLIETLVASVILVVIVGSMTVIFIQANRSWIETEARLQVYQNSREALSAISRDISCAFQRAATPSTAATLVTFDYGGEPPTLYFTAVVNANPAVKEYDLSIIGYRMHATAANTIQKYKEDYDGSQVAPWVPNTARWNPLAENITSLDFEFWDHQAPTPGWVADWDAAVKDYLPQAVRITLDSADKQDRFSRQFQTIVYIPTH